MDLITAAGAPAFVMEFNTPNDSRELVRSVSVYASDHLRVTKTLWIDAAVSGDFSRGSLPLQTSAAGYFASSRTFGAQADLILWNNVSPRTGFAWEVPHSHGLTIRGAYSRQYAPLAGRYLDFGNPNSLGGTAYQWHAASATTPFQAGDLGTAVFRFGGPYSSIDPGLRRPYSDTFDVGADVTIARQSKLSLGLFRRDDKNRLAAMNVGVPASAFSPVSMFDPGPDGIPGTFDDQRLTVYSQNPATLGQDRYLLTNPAGLRMRSSGVQAQAGTAWRGVELHASFVAERSYGPTNPGNTVYENDSGVIGSLFMDPNTTINAAGQSYIDRAFIGKVQGSYRIPNRWGGIEISTVATYMDGLVFARQLLVTGLPQGPFLVAATPRGSIGAGNRAQYVVNWNLRVSRQFAMPFGVLAATADALNVSNAGQQLQQEDITGTSFNLRLPVAIQAPRFLRLGLRYEF